ncbi:MAG: lipopolysaccharide assembly protein LapA domain-containing protein [Syntrophobacteraceae bacterium]
MRLFKELVTLLILCVAAIFIYQNIQTWTQPVGFKLDLYLYKINPELKLYPVILLSALGGFIVGLALMLKPYFKTRRLLKRERQEKKQAQEEFTLRLARAESHAAAPTPAPAHHTNQVAETEAQEAAEKEEEE